VSFAVPDAYDRFMGRYSTLLAPQFADLARVNAGQRVLDVGCGPGALIEELVKRLGAEAISAADPSPPFVTAVRERYPEVDVHLAAAEALPFPDRSFDATLAQLVVHFMTDPVTGLREMRRVTRPGGVVAACVWDLAGDQGPLNVFWAAARRLDPAVRGESDLPGVRQGDLGELFRAAGLIEVEETSLVIAAEHASFEDWWEPFTLGVGPAGSYLATLEPDRHAELRELARAELPAAPFVLDARAWAARGTVHA
jgi:SAM-dependent methyltransferase